ncbi:sodium:phosphate symporter [Paenibacillus selenitireducens]|uniref:Sodium:phosphate symporter n=1 Tax=Paenibacillus selenitireducens TaxID=1324314 RepID=A0A1T2XES6_9BACL|nr:Na/Pi symporter [Paenibacillus selenitireducens]OPA78397.1 sodium:phosphate symporter [Paenibacillus selenitireducens]
MFGSIVFPLLYGLSLFLFGMKLMELALNLWAGPYLTRAIAVSTKTPLRGLLFSTGITALLQSSTAVTVITMGLVNAGLLPFARSLGIILGSNIGTCLTTELIGLNINQYALPLMAGSVSIWALTVLLAEYRPHVLHGIMDWLRPAQFLSLAVFGFALILFGIEEMKSIAPALQERGLFNWFLEQSAQSMLWGLAAGACITAIIHSSAAMIGLTMGLAAMGAIPVELGIAIVIGSNVGTCVTALIASLGGSRSGSYVAWTHIVLNVGGAILFYPLLAQLHTIAGWMTPDPSAQIAHAQTIFNIASSLLALPFCYLPVWNRMRTIT